MSCLQSLYRQLSPTSFVLFQTSLPSQSLNCMHIVCARGGFVPVRKEVCAGMITLGVFKPVNSLV